MEKVVQKAKLLVQALMGSMFFKLDQDVTLWMSQKSWRVLSRL